MILVPYKRLCLSQNRPEERERAVLDQTDRLNKGDTDIVRLSLHERLIGEIIQRTEERDRYYSE